MKLIAYVLVFDGLADWEPANALCEINKSMRFDVLSVGFSDRPITTTAGPKLRPEITLSEVNPGDAGRQTATASVVILIAANLSAGGCISLMPSKCRYLAALTLS